jgi:hypothetical protein
MGKLFFLLQKEFGKWFRIDFKGKKKPTTPQTTKSEGGDFFLFGGRTIERKSLPKFERKDYI